MIYNKYTDETIFAIHTEKNNLWVLIGDDKTYVQRKIQNDECKKTVHPFMQLVQYGNGQAQNGLRQVSPCFNNLFIEHYYESSEATEEEEEWKRSVVYVHQLGEKEFKPISVTITKDEETKLQDFGKVMRKVWTHPEEERKFYKYNVVGKNQYDQSRMFELANDDRRIKPRINCQFEDLVDDEGNQLYGAGMYIELFDLEENAAIEGT